MSTTATTIDLERRMLGKVETPGRSAAACGCPGRRWRLQDVLIDQGQVALPAGVARARGVAGPLGHRESASRGRAGGGHGVPA